MLKALLLNALLVGATYAASGCHVDASLSKIGTTSLLNPILGVTLKNTGSCPITNIKLDVDLAKGCVIADPVDLVLNPDGTVTPAGLTTLGVGASISSSTFVLVCVNPNDALNPQVSVKEVLCDSSCTATTAPTTKAPTTAAPTTKAPTALPTTKAPTTRAPTTKAPTTAAPTTKAPTTAAPTTKAPTTAAPTTKAPTTAAPTTKAPTSSPCAPCAEAVEQYTAISFSSVTGKHGISVSEGAAAAVSVATGLCVGPACASVLIVEDQCAAIAISTKTSTNIFVSGVGAGNNVQEAEAKALANCNCRASRYPGVTCTLKASACPKPTCPPTSAPTTKAPTTKAPTTAAPTTKAPTTQAPTTKAPTTQAPTTKAPTTAAPTTQAPTTKAPTTAAPTTKAPTTAAPTTKAPTAAPVCKVTTDLVDANVDLGLLNGLPLKLYNITAVNAGTCVAADVSVKIDPASGCVIANLYALTHLSADVYLLDGAASLQPGASVNAGAFAVVCLNPSANVALYGVNCPNCN